MTRVSLEEALTAAEEQPPAEGLRIVAAVRAQLSALEALHVEKAIRAGWSWRQVAEQLGVTKQAAHKKHGRKVAAVAAAAEPDRKKLLVTGRARLCVRYAREEARALGAGELRPEHLLLGLLRDEESVAARALTSAGVALPEARTAARAADREASPPEGEPLPVGVLARAAMENSLREAVARGDGYLGVEHLLLALLHVDEPATGRVAAALGGNPGAVERELERTLVEAV